jgi:AcrR family transcriptional regulator
MTKPTGSNKDNLERTRKHLLAVAAECFAEHGYAECSTTSIIKIAKSSRGSLYHHFQGKEALFKNVFDWACEQVAHQIQSHSYKGIDPKSDLIEGCVVYLEAFTHKRFAQILLIDGPHVLGLEYCRSKDTETAYQLLYKGVLDIFADVEKTQTVSDFLSGALDTYALRIATANDRKMSFEKYAPAFRDLASNILSE